MGTWLKTVSIAIIGVLQLANLSHAAVNKTSTVLKSASYYDCFYPQETKTCEERIYPIYPTYCDAWRKMRQECFVSNRCSDSFISSKKSEFEAKYMVQCSDVVSTTTEPPVSYFDCTFPSNVKYCVSHVYPEFYTNKCDAWEEILKCYNDGRCTDTYIRRKKSTFESKYSVKCMSVYIGDGDYYRGIRISASCGNNNVTCETRLSRMTCELWHNYRKCFDTGPCLSREVEIIKNRVMKKEMLTCGTGSASASIGFVLLVATVLLVR